MVLLVFISLREVLTNYKITINTIVTMDILQKLEKMNEIECSTSLHFSPIDIVCRPFHCKKSTVLGNLECLIFFFCFANVVFSAQPKNLSSQCANCGFQIVPNTYPSLELKPLPNSNSCRLMYDFTKMSVTTC